MVSKAIKTTGEDLRGGLERRRGDDRQGVPGNFDADILELWLAARPDYQFGHEAMRLNRSLHRLP